MKHSIAWYAAVICALGSSACASSASNLRLGDIPRDQGALFGNVEVVNEGENVTGSCYVTFTDGGDVVKGNLSLDETGWVFTAVAPGPTYLNQVRCLLGGFIKYNATYDARDLSLEVPGGDKIAYFGHVRVDLNSKGSGIVAATMLGGALGNLAASAGEGENAGAVVANRFDQAKREYESRYGKLAATLEPAVSIAGQRSASLPSKLR